MKNVVLMKIGGELIKDSSLECFGKGKEKGKKRGRSVVVNLRWVEGGFLE